MVPGQTVHRKQWKLFSGSFLRQIFTGKRFNFRIDFSNNILQILLHILRLHLNRNSSQSQAASLFSKKTATLGTFAYFSPLLYHNLFIFLEVAEDEFFVSIQEIKMHFQSFVLKHIKNPAFHSVNSKNSLTMNIIYSLQDLFFKLLQTFLKVFLANL